MYNILAVQGQQSNSYLIVNCNQEQQGLKGQIVKLEVHVRDSLHVCLIILNKLLIYCFDKLT